MNRKNQCKHENHNRHSRGNMCCCRCCCRRCCCNCDKNETRCDKSHKEISDSCCK